MDNVKKGWLGEWPELLITKLRKTIKNNLTVAELTLLKIYVLQSDDLNGNFQDGAANKE
jgi:hypothetical protein